MLIAVCMIAGTAFAQENDDANAGYGPGLHSDIEFGEAGGQTLLLDAFVPQDGDAPQPVVIFVHGGGWKGGDKADDASRVVTDTLTDAGFTWFSINYRLGPEHTWPAQHDDVRTAIQWVKANAARFGGDPSRIALVGYSAGGQIATYTAVTADEDTAVQAIVCLAVPNDLVLDTLRREGISEYLGALIGTQDLTPESQDLLWEISAINHLHPDLPPFLFIHGTADESVPYMQSQHMIQRLDALDVPNELITIDGGTHRIMEWGESNDTYRQQMTEWIANTLGD